MAPQSSIRDTFFEECEDLLEALAEQGVDVAHCHQAPNARTPVSAVLVTTMGALAS